MAKRRIHWIGLTKRQEKNARRFYEQLKNSGKTEDYSKRIARGLATGKTKQASRGKPQKEHIVRKEREREEHGIAKSELKSVQSFLKRFNPRDYKDVPTEEDLVEFIQENGYSQFQQYRTIWDAARKTYVKEQNEGTYESRGMGYLFDLMGRAGVPDEQWMYYH